MSAPARSTAYDPACIDPAKWWLTFQKWPPAWMQTLKRLHRAATRARERANSSLARGDERQVLLADADLLQQVHNDLVLALRSVARVEAICEDMPFC